MVDPANPNGNSVGIPYNSTSVSGNISSTWVQCSKCGNLHPKEGSCIYFQPLTAGNYRDFSMALLWAEVAQLNETMAKVLAILQSLQGDGK